MKISRKSILFLVSLLLMAYSQAQFDPSSISRIENGRIKFSLDLRWTDVQKKEIERLFSLDSTVWIKIIPATPVILLDSIAWEVKHISESVVELSKKIESRPAVHFNENDIFLIDDNWKWTPGYVDMDKVIFGANSFKKGIDFRYQDGSAQFYLPGYPKAKEVYIAGSFNNWDPRHTLMQKVDSGWIVNMVLPAGKYFYKYVMDGNWMKDPYNELSENDGQGNINSTIYATNYLFRLNGYGNARKVFVAGTFNNWNRKELKMIHLNDGWSLPVYLKEGTYSYKFIVDDEWINDPANPKTRRDGKGNLNSVIGNGEEYTFRLKGFTNAEHVFLAGSFNNWDSNELMMDKTPDGWQLPYQLAPGNYEYKFVVDGNWMTDPLNPFTIGTGNYTNSCLSFKSNYEFVLDEFRDARDVKLTGSFNNWSTDGYKMIKKDGKWTYSIYLSPGKYLYKLIVDGNWVTDPENKLWEENEYGTGNSVLWINDSKNVH